MPDILPEIVADHIDLCPLMDDPEATHVLMLARGQLNRAFRSQGLTPLDSLTSGDFSGIDPVDLDDPAALGIENALARFQEDFLLWASRMPATLVQPVMEILRQTHQALKSRRGGDLNAIVTAYEFLSAARTAWI